MQRYIDQIFSSGPRYIRYKYIQHLFGNKWWMNGARIRYQIYSVALWNSNKPRSANLDSNISM